MTESFLKNFVDAHFYGSCLFGFGFPTTGLSSLFVELTDNGFLFKVEVTSEELSVISFVTCQRAASYNARNLDQNLTVLPSVLFVYTVCRKHIESVHDQITQSHLFSLYFPHYATPADFNIVLSHVSHSVNMSPRTAQLPLAMQCPMEMYKVSRCFRYYWKQNSLFMTKKHTRGIIVSLPNGVLQPKGSVCRNTSRARTFLPEPMRWVTCRLRGERSDLLFCRRSV